VKKTGAHSVPISGDCSRLGPPKPWARTIPEPCKLGCFSFYRAQFFSTCKDDANQQKVSVDLLSIGFLDGK
jgi:hypothetical protein